MKEPYRFILDEHMRPLPGLPADLLGFEIQSLRDFHASFVNTATPDWVIYLAVAQRNYTGLITHDFAQLGQENEVRALQRTGISIITFRKGIADEITKWGLLLAYSQRILRQLDQGERGAFVLPAPATPDVRKADDLLRQLKRAQGVSAKEIRDRADRAMQEDLARRKLSRLWPK